MGINFGTMPQRQNEWTVFKSIIVLKGFAPQYEEDPGTYTIYGYDGPEVNTCTIWKGEVPPGVVSGGYSQGQNDSDKADFEANYKPYANQSIAAPQPTLVDGYVTTTDSTTTRVMGTVYNEPSSNAQRSVVSSSASDTSAGTGARTLRITYYDQVLAGPFTENITLNGTSAVNTVATNICFIEKMEVLTVGSNGANAGTITLKSTTGGGGTDVGSIAVGDAETNWCHHYIGANRTTWFGSLRATISGTASGVVTVRKAQPTVANAQELTVTPAIRAQPGEQKDAFFPVPLKISGPARISLYVRSDSSTATLSWNAGFAFHEV